MSLVPLRTDILKKPVGRLRLNKSHPLYQNLIGFFPFNPTHQFEDLCGNFTLSSSTDSFIEHNLLRQTVGSSSFVKWDYNGNKWSNDLTIAWGVRIDTNASFNVGIALDDWNGFTGHSSSTGTIYVGVAEAQRLILGSFYSNNSHFDCLYTMNDGDDTEAIYRNGAEITSAVGVGTPALPSQFLLGSDTQANSQWWSYTAIFNSTVNAELARQLTHNIWQLVEEVEPTSYFFPHIPKLPLADVIRSLNPKRFYTMEESEGTLNDQGSDNGKATPVNTLTYRQRSILPKRNGASILFGATGHFSLVTNFTYKSDFTLAFPVKFKENPGATSTIFAQYHTNASAGGILIFVGTDGVLHADGKVPTSSTYEANAGTRNVCDNNEHWCTIIVVNNEVKIYIDGELDVISSGGSFNNGTYYNTNAYIGQLNNSNYWKSSLQYLAMWNKALSEDQAKYMARAAINDMPKAAPTYTEANLLKEPNLWVPKKKPIGPVKIDWAHELTDGLIGFWILNRSQTCNLVNNLPATIRGSTGSISPYAGEGDTYHNTGAASSGYETYDNMGTNATTVAARVELVGGSNNYIASHTWPGSGSMPWNLAPTPLSWGFSMYTGSVWQKSGVSTNIIGAGMTDVGGRGWFNGTNMTLEYLVDGNVDSTIDVTGTTMVRNGTAEFVIGAYAPSSYGINGHLSYIAVWNKRLTLEAFRDFQRNPYQFLITI